MIKSTLLISFFVVLSAGFFSSCSKTPAPTVSNEPKLIATINGAPWTGTNVSASDDSKIITILATAADGTKLSMGLDSYVKVGTYSITETGKYNLQYNTKTNLYQANSGSIVVTSYENKIIKGTFSASAPNFSNPSDVKSITGGSFTAKF